MNNNCIISFCNEKGRYVQNMARLSESLRNNFDGDFLGFIGDKSLDCEPHSENPYAFKIAAFKVAIDKGYKNVMWLDTSCFAIKNVQPVFDEIENEGFIFQEAGHYVGKWTNDFTLNYFGLTRNEANEMIMIGNAGFLGLDFSKSMPKDFFNKWDKAMQAGCFKGSWEDHRHDMSCSSIIINQMGIMHVAKKGDEWLQYAGVFDETANDKIIIKAQG